MGVMVQAQGSGWKVQPLMGRTVGVIFNQTLTENYFGKCTYLLDGAASYNVNYGCGDSAPGPASCDNPNSAFYNKCTTDRGASYHDCSATDPAITSRMCKGPDYGTITPPQFKSAATCFYEMPALLVPRADPTHTILAFVYLDGTSTSARDAKGYATRMRDQFQEAYGVQGVSDIPVIELDARNDFTQSGGPFKLPSSLKSVVVV